MKNATLFLLSLAILSPATLMNAAGNPNREHENLIKQLKLKHAEKQQAIENLKKELILANETKQQMIKDLRQQKDLKQQLESAKREQELLETKIELETKKIDSMSRTADLMLQRYELCLETPNEEIGHEIFRNQFRLFMNSSKEN